MQDGAQPRRSAPKIGLALLGIAGHIATGLVLGVLFVALFVASGDTPAQRLLLQSDNAPVLLIIVMLHAALFTCASLATAEVSAGSET